MAALDKWSMTACISCGYAVGSLEETRNLSETQMRCLKCRSPEEQEMVCKEYNAYVKLWNENKHYKGVAPLMTLHEWWMNRLLVSPKHGTKTPP